MIVRDCDTAASCQHAMAVDAGVRWLCDLLLCGCSCALWFAGSLVLYGQTAACLFQLAPPCGLWPCWHVLMLARLAASSCCCMCPSDCVAFAIRGCPMRMIVGLLWCATIHCDGCTL